MGKPEVTEHCLRKATLMCIAKASLNRAGLREISALPVIGPGSIPRAEITSCKPGAIRKTFASWLGFISSR